MRWSNDHFPARFGRGYFIRASHFRKTYTTNNEYNQTRNIFHCCLCFILFKRSRKPLLQHMHVTEKLTEFYPPYANDHIEHYKKLVTFKLKEFKLKSTFMWTFVSIAVQRSDWYLPSWCMVCGILSSSSQKWEMTTIQLIINTIFKYIFEYWCPAGHLICLFSYTIFSWYLIWFFAISLQKSRKLNSG